jgi:hypothetical protein
MTPESQVTVLWGHTCGFDLLKPGPNMCAGLDTVEGTVSGGDLIQNIVNVEVSLKNNADSVRIDWLYYSC